MNSITHCIALAWAVLIITFPSGLFAAVPEPRSGGAKLSDFKIIQERNIFNPNRYVRSSNNERRTSSRTVASDNLVLTGVMAYEKGTFAFFDGSRSSYRKVVKPGESLAEFKVVEIQAQSVKLISGTNDFEVPVGTQMRKEEGSWRLAGRVEFASTMPPPPSRSSPVSSTVSNAPATVATNDPAFQAPPEFYMPMVPGEPGQFVEGGVPPELPEGGRIFLLPPAAETNGGAEDDVLKRLMQRREQEMNQ